MKGNVCVMVAVLVLTAAGLRAQGDRGIITGTVKDASGAVLPGALVTATHLATKTTYKSTTTASGDFTVPSLPVGDYQVRVEARGFKTDVANDLVVAAGGTVRGCGAGVEPQQISVNANVGGEQKRRYAAVKSAIAGWWTICRWS